MNQFINSIPKGLLAFLVLFGGILFIVLGDPPKTVCDAQLEVFNKTQSGFLNPDPKSKAEQKTTKFDRLFEHCKVTNSAGGCLELFHLTQRMLEDLAAVPLECRDKVASLASVKKVILYMSELMVRLAWTEKPPGTYAQKFGWMDVAEVSLYCRLKARQNEYFGKASWDELREKLLKGLPGAETMSRNQVWDLSILSENCDRYP